MTKMLPTLYPAMINNRSRPSSDDDAFSGGCSASPRLPLRPCSEEMWPCRPFLRSSEFTTAADFLSLNSPELLDSGESLDTHNILKKGYRNEF